MTLKIHEERGLVCFRVHVQPSARSSEIVGLWNGSLKIKVAAPAQDLRANHALLEFLAETPHLTLRQLVVARGDRSREKTIGVKGLSRLELSQSLASHY